MTEHELLKKKLENYNLISNIDYNRSCGALGYTDMSIKKVERNRTTQSKFYISMDIDNKPQILYLNNLEILYEELNELFVKNKYFGGYNPKTYKIRMYYQNDGIIRFGNFRGKESFNRQFDLLTFDELARRENPAIFLKLCNNQERHRAIQAYLAILGIKLGFLVKFAINDEDSIKKLFPDITIDSTKILGINDIILNNILEKSVKKNLNLIDVLWVSPITHNISYAFEIEFQRKYTQVLDKFSVLKRHSKYSTKMIYIGNDCMSFKEKANSDMYKSYLSECSVGLIFVEDIISAVDTYFKYKNLDSCQNLLFNMLNNKTINVYN